jgi:hypothetical protein
MVLGVRQNTNTDHPPITNRSMPPGMIILVLWYLREMAYNTLLEYNTVAMY